MHAPPVGNVTLGAVSTNAPSLPLLSVEGVSKEFRVRGRQFWSKQLVRAVDRVSLDVRRGETLGIVGESGCGKSTLARLITRLVPPDAGVIRLDGKPVGQAGGAELRTFRKHVQMVFQDSHASLNPRTQIARILSFGPRIHGVRSDIADARAYDLLDRVGLNPRHFAGRYPHELSGGQRQRVNIARALSIDPQVVVLDEAVSALDKSIEAQILELLSDLKRERDLTYIFISHDLNVVYHMSDRVAVMYLGRVVEIGPVEQIYNESAHPYTRALLSAVPSLNPRARTRSLAIAGDPPSPIDPPSGCHFRTRCPFAEEVCGLVKPELVKRRTGQHHFAACHIGVPESGHSLQNIGMSPS